MKQKEIYLAEMNPILGKEQGGTRPVVVISGAAMNDYSELCIVCVITSKIKNFATSVLIKKDLINKLKKDSEILTFQIRTISQKRFLKKIGEITDEQLIKVFDGLLKTLRY